MIKFIALNAFNLRLNDLAGVTSETVAVASQQSSSVLGALGTARLRALETVNNAFLKLLRQRRASELTPLIGEKSLLCRSLFAEIRRTAKTGRLSSLPAIADAGNELATFLHPFRNTGKEPLMSRIAQVKLIRTRYAADPALAQAAARLGINTQIQALFTANGELESLYNRRLNETGTLQAPSASSLKSDVAKAYDDFCAVIRMTLPSLPSEALQLLFNEMNGIRRKYAADRPAPLDGKHTTAAPVGEQLHTGRPVTPLPRVFYRTDGGEVRELVFTRDYTVAYRNNVETGEARLLVRGKGKYAGCYDVTFHIIRPHCAGSA